jgi:hypothetical protein
MQTSTDPNTSAQSLLSALRPKPIYYGLTKDSYGPLIIYTDADTHQPVTVQPCDPTHQYADVNELARQLTAAIASPTQDVFKPDDPIAIEELQHNFKIASDPSGYAPVTILDRSPDGIVFWYYSELVILPEVANAAMEFCRKAKRVAVYEGSARKCSEPQENFISINGQHTRIDTYAISSFRCVRPSEASNYTTVNPSRVRQ